MGVLAIAVMAGCSSPAELRRYTVEKPPHRMLAAMVTREREAWFFKLSGPRVPIAAQDAAFQEFLTSLRFSDGPEARPEWDLPKGWKQLPGNEQRFATIEIEAPEKSLELTVTRLPMPPQGDVEAYQLQNINRWRQQLHLGPLPSEKAFQSETASLTSRAGIKVTWVNYVGKMNSPKPGGPMSGMGGMAGLGPPHGMEGDMAGADPHGGDPHAGMPPDVAPPAAGKLPFEFKAPDEWKTLPAAGMRRLAFRAGDEDEVPFTEITVTNLSAAANDLLSNVNRWRDQVRLKPLTDAELKDNAKPLNLGEAKGHYVEMIGEGSDGEASKQAIIGAIVVHRSQMWFFKMKGPRDTAVKERERFLAFIQSVRFQSGGA